jgi:hypothetical protein
MDRTIRDKDFAELQCLLESRHDGADAIVQG